MSASEMKFGKQQRALEMLQQAAQEVTPKLSIQEILQKTVQLASELMSSSGASTRYFSHIAVKEGDRLYFDLAHNDPFVHNLLVNSLGPEAEINLSLSGQIDPNGKRIRIGITGAAARDKTPLNVPDVEQHPEYIDLKNAGGSQIAVPILIDEEVFAVLNIEHETKNAFDEQDMQTMIALTSIVSAIIDSKENSVALQGLIKAVRALTSTIDQQNRYQFVLDEVARQAYNLMSQKARKPGAFAHVGIVQGSTLIYVAAEPQEILNRFGDEQYSSIDLLQFGQYDEAGQRRRIGISGYAVVTNQPQKIPDVHSHPEYLMVNLDATTPGRTINAQLAVPIRAPSGEILGVISIDHPSFDAFTDEDVSNVTLLAEIAAEAIQFQRKSFQQSVALDILVSMARLDIDSLTINSLLGFVNEQARRLFKGEIGHYKQYTSHLAIVEGDEMVFKAEHNSPEDYSELVRHGYQRFNYVNPPVGKKRGIVGRAALNNRTEHILDVSKDEDYFEIRRSGSQLSVPLRAGEEVYAVLTVEHDKINGFDAQDRVTLEALATQASAMIAILNSQLQAARLEERVKYSDDFIRFVRHDLRNPLTNVETFLMSLRLKPYNDIFLISDFQERYNGALSELRDHIRQIDRLIEIASEEVRKTAPNLQRIDLIPIIESTIKLFQEAASLKTLFLTPNYDALKNNSLFVRADPHSVKSALENLVENAIKFTDTGSVAIQVSIKDNMAAINVEDTGIGIPEDLKGQIFEKYVRAEGSAYRGRDGFGIGLTLVRHYAELNGGKIELVRSDKTGSTFALYLPLYPDS